jgi:hypothetical protein
MLYQQAEMPPVKSASRREMKYFTEEEGGKSSMNLPITPPCSRRFIFFAAPDLIFKSPKCPLGKVHRTKRSLRYFSPGRIVIVVGWNMSKPAALADDLTGLMASAAVG